MHYAQNALENATSRRKSSKFLMPSIPDLNMKLYLWLQSQWNSWLCLYTGTAFNFAVSRVKFHLCSKNSCF